MLAWVNDEIIGRKTAAEKKEEDHKDDDSGSTGNGAQEESKGGESEEKNQGISPFITALIIIIEHPESNRGVWRKGFPSTSIPMKLN